MRRPPVIHFAARPDAAELVHAGHALCGAGWSHRTEHEQYVTGNRAYVTCRNCQRSHPACDQSEAI